MSVGSEERRGVEDRVEQFGRRAKAIVEIENLGETHLQLDPFARVERPRVEIAKRGPGLLQISPLGRLAVALEPNPCQSPAAPPTIVAGLSSASFAASSARSY